MQTNEPRIDPEIAAVLLPLTELERAHLDHSLKTEGLREPLVVWAGHGVLLDGHARLEIARSLEIEVRTVEIDLPDREAAIAWRLRQQIGRRNLNPVAASYFRGRLYGLLRKKPGRPKGAKPGQNARKSTDEALARQFGVDPRTCRRDSRFCEALDSLAEDFGSEFRTRVLTRHSNLTRAGAVKVAEMAPQERERFLRQQEEERSRPKAARRRPDPATSGLDRTEGRSAVASTADEADDRRRLLIEGQKGHAPPSMGDADPADSDSNLKDLSATPAPGEPATSVWFQRLNDAWEKTSGEERRLFAARPDVRAAVEEVNGHAEAGKDGRRKQSA